MMWDLECEKSLHKSKKKIIVNILQSKQITILIMPYLPVQKIISQELNQNL